jgi:hypothetical protein
VLVNFVRSAVTESRKASLGVSFWQRVSYTFRRTTCVQPVHDPPSDGTRATAATVNPLQVEQSLKVDYCRAAGIEWLQDRTAREPSKNPKTTAVYDGFSERCAREERWFLSIPSARSASCGTAQGGLGLDDGDCVGVMAIV